MTWQQLFDNARETGARAIVSALKPYFCTATGGHFKRGMAFNVDANGELWLKNGKSIKWQYEPAIRVDPESPVCRETFYLEFV